MTNNRELIERDKKYQHLKHVILHLMCLDGYTPWMTFEEWLEALPGFSVMQYRRKSNDMLDDTEIRCEYDRDSIPVRTRWVVRSAE